MYGLTVPTTVTTILDHCKALKPFTYVCSGSLQKKRLLRIIAKKGYIVITRDDDIALVATLEPRYRG